MNNAYYKFLVVLLLMVLTVSQKMHGQTSSVRLQSSANINGSSVGLQAGTLAIQGQGTGRVSLMSNPGHYGFAAWRNQGESVHQEVSINISRQLLPVANSLAIAQVDKNFYTKNFGFFCRKELQVEKATKIPLRLRIGSLEQCNRLEEKY